MMMTSKKILRTLKRLQNLDEKYSRGCHDQPHQIRINRILIQEFYVRIARDLSASKVEKQIL